MAVRASLLAVAFSAGALVAHAAAPAEVNSTRPDKVAVTIYRDGPVDTRELVAGGGPDGLVLVRETRTIDLPAGLARVRFSDVADRIIPQSAAIEGLPAGAVERNFDYDLLSPGALLEKSVGAPVRLIRTNPRTGAVQEVRATIRAAPDGVALEIDGAVEALHCSGLPERLVFDSAPATLMASPTLSASIETPQAGRYQIRLSYLAIGLVWSADYVARVNAGGKTLDLTGWVTLANRSGTTFADAPTEVVAGTLSRVGDEAPPVPAARDAPPSCWPINSGRMQAVRPPPPPPPPMAMAAPATARMAEKMSADEIVVTAAKQIAPRNLGDYKLYELPEPTRVAARQIKQVQFLDKRAVPFQRIYRFKFSPREFVYSRDRDQRRAARTVVRLKNDASHGLGLPLPAGHAAVYEQAAAGAPLYAGADQVRDTPVGLPWDLEIGGAADVGVRTRLLKDERPKKGARRVTIEIEVTNSKPFAADVELAQFPDAAYRISGESKSHVLREGLFVWPYKLQPGARATFRYTLAFRG